MGGLKKKGPARKTKKARKGVAAISPFSVIKRGPGAKTRRLILPV